MKTALYIFMLLLIALGGHAQGIIRLDDKGLGIPQFATNPTITATDKGKVIYNTTLNKLLYCDGTAWVDPTTGGAPSNWINSGSDVYIGANGHVSIGTPFPTAPLTISAVNGFPIIRAMSTNTSSVIDIESRNADAIIRFLKNFSISWEVRSRASTGNFEVSENGEGPWLLIQNTTGNVGIGTSTPSQKLDVNGNAAISGQLTVAGGRGIVQSGTASQLKVTRAQYSVTAILAGHERSGEFSINFPAGIFTQIPTVTVGDEVLTSYTSGETFRVLLKLYGCTVTGCKARLINTSPNPVNYGIKYNVVITGE